MKTLLNTRVEAGFWMLVMAALILIVTGNTIYGAIMTGLAITQFKTIYVSSKIPAIVRYKVRQFIYKWIFKFARKQYLVHQFNVQEVVVIPGKTVRYVFLAKTGYYLAIKEHGVLFRSTVAAMRHLSREFSNELAKHSLDQSTTL